MDVVVNQLEKARIFAYFGFAGLAIPVIGIISGCASISILNRLTADGDDETAEKERIYKLATTAIGISALVLAMYILLAVVTSVQLSKVFEAANVQQQTTEIIENS